MNEMVEKKVAQEVRKGSGWVVVLGILIIILGGLAIGTPFVAGAATTIFVGSFILLAGIFQIIHVFQVQGKKAKALAFFGGILSILCGGLLLARPVFGLGLLTMFLIAYFVVDVLDRLLRCRWHRQDRGGD